MKLAILVIVSIALVACERSSAPLTVSTTATPTIAPTASPTPALAATPIALPPQAAPFITVQLASDVPATVRVAVEHLDDKLRFKLLAPDNPADLIIGSEATSDAPLLTERVYAPVAAFPTLRSAVTFAQLREAWQGKAASGIGALYASDETVAALNQIMGAPAASVKRVKPDDITTQLWKDPNAAGIVPFDELSVKFTALKLDGVNILSHDASLERYPLIVRWTITGDAQSAQRLIAALRPTVPTTNRDSQRITTLVMTGTTAITRVSAYRIEQQHDPVLPARKIAPVVSRADIVHVSNEVSFVADCKPSIALGTLEFCSKPSYLDALKLLGVTIVGLTGNHLLDFGPHNFMRTLDIYDQAGMKYYGGGRDATEASKTLFLTDHGNRLAFLGANPIGPETDWATAVRPGSLLYNATALAQHIADARRQADVVLVELQGEETYDYRPPAGNVQMYQRTLTAGADVVTGVQAHQPQGIEFDASGTKIILYGLGNLFFDQVFSEGVRQGLIVRHTIYHGRLLQTELLPTMRDDEVQPRFATPAERERIMRAVFAASGFKTP
ncbi:MAG: CapA family protein [Chloroflexota bacterium]